MPVEKDVQELQHWWCPKWYWPFAVCSGIRTAHKWCYNFSWVEKTAYVFVVHCEGCENGKLFTWNEAGLGIGPLDKYIPPGEMCFDSPRTSSGICDPSNTGLAAYPLTADQQQADWRFCRKCHAMFFDGYPRKGVCPGDDLKLMAVGTLADLNIQGRNLLVVALVGGTQLHVRMFDGDGKRIVDKAEPQLIRGEALTDLKKLLTSGRDYPQLINDSRQRLVDDIASVVGDADFAVAGHVAAGYNFTLPHDVAASGSAQENWRYCNKCHEMFFDGYANKGVCPSGNGHLAEGFNFVLPHDVSGSASAQSDWRYCHKCHAMFFDGYPDKGVCAAGGGHAAAGFNFVLRHG